MGVLKKNASSSPSFLCLNFILLLSLLSCFRLLFADVDSRTTPPPSPSPPPPPPSSPDAPGGVAALSFTKDPSLSPPPISPIKASPFRPTIAVTVGILTTVFSITFLLLLYAKHCKGSSQHGSSIYDGNNADPNAAAGRKNSGIDRTVIESLPMFRFSSLRGQKDGLECAVCLTKFEPTEILRLLPKCKHAFHVECVDTWLDAHSTCPLCRYRVDPEDILLVEDANSVAYRQNQSRPPQPEQDETTEQDPDIESGRGGGFRRVSGRHSSAGESGLDRKEPTTTSLFRRSLDGWSWRKKNNTNNNNNHNNNNKSNNDSGSAVAVGCFDRYQRKDGMLLTGVAAAAVTGGDEDGGVAADRTRFEHQIIVSESDWAKGGLRRGVGGGVQERWSDVQPCEVLYLLGSEMIIGDSRRYSSSSRSRPSINRQGQGQRQQQVVGDDGGGSSVMNSRSVSEITGLKRFSTRGRGGGGGEGWSGSNTSSRSSSNHVVNNNNNNNNNNHNNNNNNGQEGRVGGMVSRWLAWNSSQTQQPAVRWDTSTTSTATATATAHAPTSSAT